MPKPMSSDDLREIMTRLKAQPGNEDDAMRVWHHIAALEEILDEIGPQDSWDGQDWRAWHNLKD